jgi:mannan polymerase complexes MNN9 subunit
MTLILAGLLSITFLIFIFSSTEAGPKLHVPGARQLLKSKDAASNALSPPSLPFFKSTLKAGEKAPPPPVVHYHMNNVTNSADPVGNRESVLILTPLARFYEEYWTNLVALDYPHELISLGFIIPKGREGNVATAQLQEQIARTQSSSKRFASITILRQEDEPPISSQSEHERHAMSAQKERRAAMSRARNALLFTTLGPTTSWVLWLDSDIVETPPSLIQDLAAFDKPIIVPNCFQRYYDKEKGAMDVRPYDFNSWIDSNTAQNLAAKMGPEEILLEGYAEMATYRSLMAYMSRRLLIAQVQRRLCTDTVGRSWRQPQRYCQPGRSWWYCIACKGRCAQRWSHVPAFSLLPSDRDGGIRKDGSATRMEQLGSSQLFCTFHVDSHAIG